VASITAIRAWRRSKKPFVANGVSGGVTCEMIRGASPDVGHHRWAYYPSWSPDGRWLLFAVKLEPETMFEVAKIRLDGTDLERLAIQGFMPVWQPVPVAGGRRCPDVMRDGYGIKGRGRGTTTLESIRHAGKVATATSPRRVATPEYATVTS
jgi:WD40-like Beta Propeller Repeat